MALASLPRGLRGSEPPSPCSRVVELSEAAAWSRSRRTSCSANSRSQKTSTTSGSNCEPACATISRRAARQLIGLPVGPVARHRVERVGDREDPRRDRDLVAAEAGPDSRSRPSARGASGRPAPPPRGGRRHRRASARRAPCASPSAAAPRPESGPGFPSTSSGIAILPMSWRRKPYCSAGSSASTGSTARASSIA